MWVSLLSSGEQVDAYLLGEVDSFVVRILRTGVHSRVCVLMLRGRLMLVNHLCRRRLWVLRVTAPHASGETGMTRSVRDHRAGSQ